MTVALTKIKADVLGRTSKTESHDSSLVSAEYSLADIFREINPKDAHFLKYIPEGFLNADQMAAKQTAQQEDADKIAKLGSKPKFQAREITPDRRELLLGAAEEDRADTALSAYRKKFLAMEAAQRRLERQREALAAMEREAAEEQIAEGAE